MTRLTATTKNTKKTNKSLRNIKRKSGGNSQYLMSYAIKTNNVNMANLTLATHAEVWGVISPY
jgi:hypothetical protein